MISSRFSFITAFLCLVISDAFSQSASFNLDFETVTDGAFPGWSTYEQPNYRSFPDSVTVKSGTYSACIEFTGSTPAFGTWLLQIPQSYAGKIITLSGYIKTENVTGGYAGLWLRLDPQIGFDNMNGRGLTGTQDWTYCSVSLYMKPEETTNIALGAILAGKGKMWIDDLKITVDKKDITKAKPFIREVFPAENDYAFDNGSSIDISGLSSIQTQNLKELGLIWGYLKYYHPAVAAGKFNWDYELFRVLPAVLDAEDPDSIFVHWIESLGEFKTGGKKSRSEIKQSPDLNWIDALQFSTELAAHLHKIQTAIRPENPYYISLDPEVQNPQFKHEAAYSGMKYPDAGFRLLAIFRYWNMIQYYFPYKHLIEEDWNAVLEEFITEGIAAKNETEYTLTLLKIIGRIHDTHANIWNNPDCLNRYFGEKYAPYEIRFVEENAVVTGNYRETADLQIGDVILKVNGIPVPDIVDSLLPYTPASNYPTQLRDIGSNLLRSNDSVISVEFQHNGIIREISIPTVDADAFDKYAKFRNNDTCFRILENNIAYINNGSLKSTDLPLIWDSLSQTQGLIIDNRNYPGNFPLYGLASYLMPAPAVFTQITSGSLQNPGEFSVRTELSVGKKNKKYYPGKIVILVNEISQSSSEFHAMAYRQHPNAVVVGSTTAAADGNVSQILLPGGITTMISGIGIYTPDGKDTQRIGIVPDIRIEPTLEGIRTHKDELLEKAILVILGFH